MSEYAAVFALFHSIAAFYPVAHEAVSRSMAVSASRSRSPSGELPAPGALPASAPVSLKWGADEDPDFKLVLTLPYDGQGAERGPSDDDISGYRMECTYQQWREGEEAKADLGKEDCENDDFYMGAQEEPDLRPVLIPPYDFPGAQQEPSDDDDSGYPMECTYQQWRAAEEAKALSGTFKYFDDLGKACSFLEVPVDAPDQPSRGCKRRPLHRLECQDCWSPMESQCCRHIEYTLCHMCLDTLPQPAGVPCVVNSARPCSFPARC